MLGEAGGGRYAQDAAQFSGAARRELGFVECGEDLLPRAWELARHLKKQNPLTLRYTRMALSTRLRRRLQESLSYGLALEGISAAQVAASNAQKAKAA
jgi:enoyl-CoA hydratase/carnithine racemase